MLQESLGGCTRTILFGTVDFSSSEGSLATDDFLHNAKKVKTKPWMRHVFNKTNVIEKYITEIGNVNTDIGNICTKRNNIPFTEEDINMVSKELEENQKMISEKIDPVNSIFFSRRHLVLPLLVSLRLLFEVNSQTELAPLSLSSSHSYSSRV